MTAPERTSWYLLHKPTGVVTTLSDPEGRPTVAGLLAGVEQRVFPVGRLDWDAEGALLVTNDGEAAHRLLHPSFEVPRTYLAKVKGTPTDETLARLRDGVRLEDGDARALRADRFEVTEKNTWLVLRVGEGRPHLVKRLCAAVGHPVVRLFRPAQAGISVAGLQPGELRPLTAEEVERVQAVAAGKDVDEPTLFLPPRRHGRAGGGEDEEAESEGSPDGAGEARARTKGPRRGAEEGGADRRSSRPSRGGTGSFAGARGGARAAGRGRPGWGAAGTREAKRRRAAGSGAAASGLPGAATVRADLGRGRRVRTRGSAARAAKAVGDLGRGLHAPAMGLQRQRAMRAEEPGPGPLARGRASGAPPAIVSADLGRGLPFGRAVGRCARRARARTAERPRHDREGASVEHRAGSALEDPGRSVPGRVTEPAPHPRTRVGDLLGRATASRPGPVAAREELDPVLRGPGAASVALRATQVEAPERVLPPGAVSAVHRATRVAAPGRALHAVGGGDSAAEPARTRRGPPTLGGSSARSRGGFGGAPGRPERRGEGGFERGSRPRPGAFGKPGRFGGAGGAGAWGGTPGRGGPPGRGAPRQGASGGTGRPWHGEPRAPRGGPPGGEARGRSFGGRGGAPGGRGRFGTLPRGGGTRRPGPGGRGGGGRGGKPPR